jgi:hypothetical protein
LSTVLWLVSFLVPLFPGTAGAGSFSGVVVDGKGLPVIGATVRLQGSSAASLTDNSGRFSIESAGAGGSKYITAWKEGYYNGGESVGSSELEYRIRLDSIPMNDNKNYQWLPSLPGQQNTPDGSKTENKPCRFCHQAVTEEWLKSTHATSATNKLFLAFFSGKDHAGRENAGPGYKSDFPNANGNCATCHVPLAALKNPFDADPRLASGVDREGVSCDLCHKIGGVGIDKIGGYPGTLSISFNRPADGRQIFYGPYDDVYPGDDSYHPRYRDSSYCAPCHNGRFWGVLIYSEFQEWAESDYAAKKIHCQTCHMRPDGKLKRFATEKAGGVERPPETISSHLFYGISDRAFMEEAIDLKVSAERKDKALNVVVTVANVKSGHHYPSGNPMRNMILLVEAVDERGVPLPLADGERVPAWGGKGDVKKGNYAGFPGKGFAKVLRDSITYADSQKRRHFRPEYPASHWRPTIIESDSRIPANGKDISRYSFLLPENLHGGIRVESRLIYRRAYKSWLDAKGFPLNDMEIASRSLVIGR